MIPANRSFSPCYTKSSESSKRLKFLLWSHVTVRFNKALTVKHRLYNLHYSATSNTKQKLQVFVRTRLPRGSKTLYFELVSGTPVKSLKELIRRRVRVLPQHQHLHTKRNIEVKKSQNTSFPLCCKLFIQGFLFSGLGIYWGFSLQGSFVGRGGLLTGNVTGNAGGNMLDQLVRRNYSLATLTFLVTKLDWGGDLVNSFQVWHHVFRV